MRHQRLGDAGIEFRAPAGSALAGVQKDQLDAAFAKNFAHGTLDQRAFIPVVALEQQLASLCCLVKHAVPDEMHDAELPGRESAVDQTWSRAGHYFHFHQSGFNERLETTAN